jgi:hypothetical protein
MNYVKYSIIIILIIGFSTVVSASDANETHHVRMLPIMRVQPSDFTCNINDNVSCFLYISNPPFNDDNLNVDIALKYPTALQFIPIYEDTYFYYDEEGGYMTHFSLKPGQSATARATFMANYTGVYDVDWFVNSHFGDNKLENKTDNLTNVITVVDIPKNITVTVVKAPQTPALSLFWVGLLIICIMIICIMLCLKRKS